MTFRISAAALVALAACSAHPTGRSERTAASTGPGLPLPATYFGMHIHRADQGTPWTGHGIGAWRLLDAGVSWFHLQPARDRWDFARLDQHVAMAEAAGVEILLPLAFTPRWAAARPDEPSPYGPGHASEPARLDDWRAYVRGVATRYRGRIRTYEIWNEPHSKRFFTGSPTTLVALQDAAADELDAIDPAITLVSAAISEPHRPSLRWFEDYIAAGGGRRADVIAYHYYVPAGEPEQAVPLTRQLRAILGRHGVDRPLWNTESGWQIENADGARWPGIPASWSLLPPRRAAAYVVRALLVTRSAGVDRYYWYAWDNHAMGLIEPTTRAPKLAGRVYRALATRLAGGTLHRCTWTPPRWQCDLTTADGHAIQALWTPDGGRTRLVQRPAWATHLWRPVDETITPLAPAQPLDLTDEPVLLLQRP